MAKRPTRKKRGGSGQDRRSATQIDVDVLRALDFLSAGTWSDFADFKRPPATIRRWLQQADPREVRGLLIAALKRWRELRGT